MMFSTSNEVWLIVGESPCDEYRNSENLDYVARCLRGFAFETGRDAALFMRGVEHALHSREWRRLESSDARRMLARCGIPVQLESIVAE